MRIGVGVDTIRSISIVGREKAATAATGKTRFGTGTVTIAKTKTPGQREHLLNCNVSLSAQMSGFAATTRSR